MKRSVQTAVAVAIVALMAVACLPLGKATGKTPYALLSPEELAYAEAAGTGEYAYGIDWTYSYEYGEFEYPTGSGLMAWRGAGSAPAHAYAAYLENEMKSIGLTDVKQEEFPVHAYEFKGATVQVVDPGPGDVWVAAGHAGLPGTPAEGLTADIVYVGLGTQYDYEGKDVAGKLVLVDVSEEEMFWLQYPHMEAEVHGAIGMVVTWVEYQLLPNAIVTHDSESRPTIPALCIAKDKATELKDMIAEGITPKVKIWCDATIDYAGKGYNVIGYLPGENYGTPEDRFILVSDHYDKWWYGSSDNGASVGRMLGMAKALVDSGYTPSRTIIFVSTDAEEFGWTDTEFDWGLGAWWLIFDQHPDWAGKTLAAFTLEGGGTIDATSVMAYGTPETKEWRKSILPKIDEFFFKTEPWSAYYHPSYEDTLSFATTWADEFSLCAAGIPNMAIDSARSAYAGYDYHTNLDDMSGISAESLAMSIISNGIAIIELDRAMVVPYSFQDRAADVKAFLSNRLLNAAGVDFKPLLDALTQFRIAGEEAWGMIASVDDSEVAAEVNELLLETADTVLSEMTTVGGYTVSLYPNQHYQDDSWYVREGISLLKRGNIDGALMWLSWVYGMYTGRLVSPEVYQYLVIDRWNDPSRTDLFWGTGRLAHVEDIYAEYESLVQKKMAGITDYSDEIAQLTAHYQSVVSYLQGSVDSMAQTITDATMMIDDAIGLMQ